MRDMREPGMPAVTPGAARLRRSPQQVARRDGADPAPPAALAIALTLMLAELARRLIHVYREVSRARPYP